MKWKRRGCIESVAEDQAPIINVNSVLSVIISPISVAEWNTGSSTGEWRHGMVTARRVTVVNKNAWREIRY
jgi:hypothetical protein